MQVVGGNTWKLCGINAPHWRRQQGWCQNRFAEGQIKQMALAN